jgi:hypothetical protein
VFAEAILKKMILEIADSHWPEGREVVTIGLEASP